jgi:hypothetical protein
MGAERKNNDFWANWKPQTNKPGKVITHFTSFCREWRKENKE